LCVLNLDILLPFLLDSLEPSVAPDSFIFGFSANNITVEWNEIPSQHQMGRLQFYNVTIIGDLANGTQHLVTVSHNVTGKGEGVSNDYRLVLFGLFPFTSYRIFISACTLAGCGPETPLSVLTEEMGK